MRKERAEISDAEAFRQQFGELIDTWKKQFNLGGESCVLSLGFELACHRGVVLAHVCNAAGGRDDDGFGVAELFDKTRQHWQRFIPVAGVDMHLATAGLAGREVNRMTEALEHAHDRLACGREQGVVVTGDEERDAQGISFSGRISIQILFHNAVSVL
jgi:hypothetical protein